MLAVQKVGDAGVGTVALADHIGAEVAADIAELILVAIPDGLLVGIEHDVEVDLGRRRQLVTVDRLQFVDPASGLLEPARLGGR